jgi:hypothetical protein
LNLDNALRRGGLDLFHAANYFAGEGEKGFALRGVFSVENCGFAGVSGFAD